MSDLDDKPLADQASKPYETAAETHPAIAEAAAQRPPIPGLSVAPGLRPVPNSFARPTAEGAPVAHVFGPSQSAVDPVAAGLDPAYQPLSRAENRVITRADGTSEPARPDSEAEQAPGPTGSLVGKPEEAAAVVAEKQPDHAAA